MRHSVSRTKTQLSSGHEWGNALFSVWHPAVPTPLLLRAANSGVTFPFTPGQTNAIKSCTGFLGIASGANWSHKLGSTSGLCGRQVLASGHTRPPGSKLESHKSMDSPSELGGSKLSRQSFFSSLPPCLLEPCRVRPCTYRLSNL